MRNKVDKIEEHPDKKKVQTSLFVTSADYKAMEKMCNDPSSIYLNKSDFMRHAIRWLICHEIDLNQKIVKYSDDKSFTKIIKYVDKDKKKIDVTDTIS